MKEKSYKFSQLGNNKNSQKKKQLEEAQKQRVSNSCLKTISLLVLTTIFTYKTIFLLNQFFFTNTQEINIIQDILSIILLIYGITSFSGTKPSRVLKFNIVYFIYIIYYILYMLLTLETKVQERIQEREQQEVVSTEQNSSNINNEQENDGELDQFSLINDKIIRKRIIGISKSPPPFILLINWYFQIDLIMTLLLMGQQYLYWNAYQQMRLYEQQAKQLFLEKQFRQQEDMNINQDIEQDPKFDSGLKDQNSSHEELNERKEFQMELQDLKKED